MEDSSDTKHKQLIEVISVSAMLIFLCLGGIYSHLQHGELKGKVAVNASEVDDIEQQLQRIENKLIVSPEEVRETVRELVPVIIDKAEGQWMKEDHDKFIDDTLPGIIDEVLNSRIKDKP